MGYLNNVTGYRDDLLANRAIVKHGNFALLTPMDWLKISFRVLKTVTSPSCQRRN